MKGSFNESEDILLDLKILFMALKVKNKEIMLQTNLSQDKVQIFTIISYEIILWKERIESITTNK